MNTELKECIKDAFDPAMKSYVESDEYKMTKWELEKNFHDLRSVLSEEQQKRLNALMNLHDDLMSELALEAYYRGVVNGISLRKDVE